LNVNSLASKVEECQSLCLEHQTQILALREIYGPNSRPEAGHRFRIPGMPYFQGLYEPVEPGSHGVAVFVRKELEASEFGAPSTTHVAVLVREEENEPMLIVEL
jgi:exonuclease III